MINHKLAKTKGLSAEDVWVAEVLHKMGDTFCQKIIETDDLKELKKWFWIWTEVNFALQRIWKFEEDDIHHQSWHLPKCTCPRVDNDEFYVSGMGYQVVHLDCPLHGEPQYYNKDKNYKKLTY